MEKMKKLLPSKKDEIALLADVLTHDGDDVERLEEDFDDITLSRPGAKAKRRMNSVAFLSGGADRSCASRYLIYLLYRLFTELAANRSRGEEEGGGECSYRYEHLPSARDPASAVP